MTTSFGTTKNNDEGFTLVELMVVVTIIAILGAVAIPKYFAYVRSSRAAEVGNTGGMIVAAMQAYEDAQSATPATMVSTFNNAVLMPLGATVPTTSTNLSTLLPNLVLPQNAAFTYTVSAIIASGGDMKNDAVYCISALELTTSGAAGATVLYSSSPATTNAKGWAGRVYNQLYVTGVTAPPAAGNTTAGGYCSSSGAAQATQS